MAATLSAPMSGSAAGGGSGPSRQDLDAAVAFRAKLGLRSDRAFVAATFGDPAYASTAWGVPLDRAEDAELDRRVGAQKALGAALRRWAQDAHAAGAYVDQGAGGVVVFLSTDDPAGARRRLVPLLPQGPDAAEARFARVRHSMADLLALQELIDADVRAGAIRELGVESTAIDARANAVVVGVSSATPEIRAVLGARYGDAIRVDLERPAQGGDADPCLTRKDCPPAKGGIEIRSAYNGNNCTVGFLVRIVGSPGPRILTAGHCIGKSGGVGTSRKWTHGGDDFGWAEFSTWSDGADADAGLLSPSAAAVVDDRNRVFRASPVDLVPITGWRSTAEQIQGGLVCRAGVTSGYHCGAITLVNRTKAVDGRTIDHQWVVDFDACPGDSGGPYLLQGTAYGIHSDSTYGCDPSTNQAWYSPIGWVLSTLAYRGHPVELCTTAACGSDTNVWTKRGDLESTAWGATLVPLPDGRVLHAGGLRDDPVVVAVSGKGSLAPQVFDPATGEWAETAAPPWAPADCEGQFAVGLADGRVLVGGGLEAGGGGGNACDVAAVFDPAAAPDGSWVPAAPPPASVTAAGAALLDDGRAFVTGGTGEDGSTSVAFAYAPATDEWTALTPAPGGSVEPLVLRLLDGRVLVSGGRIHVEPDGGETHASATYLYDPQADAWSITSPKGADGMSGVVLRDGRVVIAGGRHLDGDPAQPETLVADVAVLDPSTGAWSKLAPLRTARADLTLVELDSGQLLVAGGRVPGTETYGTPARSVEVYDWGTKAWHVAPSLAAAHAGHASVVLGDGRVLVAGGGTPSTETYVPGDVLPPRVAAPSTTLRSGARMSSSSVPVRLAWTASDLGPSGVGTFDVARSTDGGAFTTIATRVPTTSWDTTVASGHTYRFQVRPRDWAGNLGAWRAGSTIGMAVLQDSSPAVKYSGTWTRATVGDFDGGSMRYAKVAGASATVSFTGRGIAWVAAHGPDRGSARVYVDGSLVATISLYAASLTYRHVVFQRTWASSGSHQIKVVVVGTSGRPVVDVDAFEVMSSP